MSNYYSNVKEINGWRFYIHNMDNYYRHYVYGYRPECMRIKKPSATLYFNTYDSIEKAEKALEEIKERFLKGGVEALKLASISI